jgi:hypothetical protein
MLATDIASLKELQRGKLVLDAGLTYDGIMPVRIRATKREGRYEFSDEGGAVAAAGVDGKQLGFADSIGMGKYSANVSRQGVVSLPGFARSSDEWLAKLPELVAEGSLALYAALLELEN